MHLLVSTLLAAVIAVSGAAAQQQSLTLELVLPDPAQPIHAPVPVLVWRLGSSLDSVTWSFRVGGRDVSSHVIRRAREFLIALPPDSALGHGKHRLTGDVCVPRGPCATADVIIEVRPPELRPPSGGDAKELLLQGLLELLRRILPGR